MSYDTYALLFSTVRKLRDHICVYKELREGLTYPVGVFVTHNDGYGEVR